MSLRKELIDIESLVKGGKLKEALDLLSRMERPQSDSWEIYLWLGRIQERLGFLENATKMFLKALAINPELPVLHRELARVFELTGRPDEAKPYLLGALRLEGPTFETRLSLGRVYGKTGRLDEAEAEFLEAADACRGSIVPYVELARLLEAAGRPRDAERYLQKALVNAPGDAGILSSLARLDRRASKVIDLSLSNVCCNKCIFCGDVQNDLPALSTRQIMHRLDELRRQGYDGLELSAKEFTLRPDAVEIIRHAQGLSYRLIHLTTNGHVFANYDKAAAFLDNGVNRLTISLHSDSTETEASITRNPASFRNKREAVANVLRVLEERKAVCEFSINTVITPLTVLRLDRIMDFVAGLGVTRHSVYFPRIQGYMAAAFDQIVPRFSDIAGPLSRGLDRGLRRGGDYSVVDVPPCILPKHARTVCPRMKKDVPRRVGEGARHEKTKGEPCSACPLSAECEGVFKGYVEKRGWAEFAPPQMPWRE